MRNTLDRVSPLTQIVISVVLLAFATMGILNAVHGAAKIVYAIVIVVALVLLAYGVRRRRSSQERP